MAKKPAYLTFFFFSFSFPFPLLEESGRLFGLPLFFPFFPFPLIAEGTTAVTTGRPFFSLFSFFFFFHLF